MAAFSSVILGAAAVMGAAGSVAEGDAASEAANQNAKNSKRNARLTREQALEDERQFRVSFLKDQGSNRVAIGASGIRMEGSAIEVLQENARIAESDALNIRSRGREQASYYDREARSFKKAGQYAGQAGAIGAAGALLSGAAQIAKK